MNPLSRRARWPGAIAAMVGVALTVTACGDGGSEGGDANTNQAGLTGEPIKVMVTAPQGNPLADFPGVFAGAQAAALAVNDAGGIGGRPIEIITCNNELSPNKSKSCARDAGNAGVVAYAGWDALASVAYSTLASKGIPSVLSAVNGSEFQTETQFPVSGGLFGELYGQALVAESAGAETVAIVAVQFPGAEENLQNTQDVARSLGVDVVDVIEVAPTQTTFSSTVEQLRDSDPDMVLISNGPPQSTTLVQSAAQLGYTPKWGYFAAPNNERDFKTIAQNAGSGALWMVSALPPASAGDQFPGISKYNAEMDNAADNNIDNADADNRNENSIDAWLQIHALAEVAATITGPVTSESMLAALKTTTDLDVEGLVTWSPGGEGTSRYPKLSDDMALYVGPVEDGVYAPESDEPVRVLDIAGTATGG